VLRYSLLSALLIWIEWNLLTADGSLTFKYFAFLFFSTAVCVCLYSMVDVFFHKLIITQETLSVKRLAGIDILYIKDIEGFREGENHQIHIIPVSSSREALKISRGFEKQDEIIRWVSKNLRNLNPAAETTKQEILTNPDFGPTVLTREARLKETTRLTQFIEWTGIAVFFWVTLYPKPYELSILMAICFPVGAAIVAIFHNGLIKLNAEKNSIYPSLSSSFIIPGCALLTRVLLDFEILTYYNFLWYGIGFTAIVLAVILLWNTKEIRFKALSDLAAVLALSFMLYIYLFGVYMIVNCQFDKTKPLVFDVRVFDKQIKDEKRTTYYLTLGPWGPRTSPEKVKVASAQYNQIAVGDTVHVYLHVGKLKTSWFNLSSDD
jgi:hypothetical protein